MSILRPTVGVTGATGPVGQQLVARLSKAGVAVLNAESAPEALRVHLDLDHSDSPIGPQLGGAVPPALLVTPLDRFVPDRDGEAGGARRILAGKPQSATPGVLSVAWSPCTSFDALARCIAAAAQRNDDDQRVVVCAAPSRDTRAYLVGKRAIDLAFAFAVVLALGWLIALLWLAVRLTSPGGGFFVQERIGRNGEPFRLFKLRTMAAGSPQAGTHEVSQSHTTPIGRRLRHYKLDELPQVINLLNGTMSLVGPRPCLPVQRELIEARLAVEVFAVAPGITGLAQVNGIDMSNPQRLAQVDAVYAAAPSLLGDIKLIVATFLGRGNGDFTRAD